MDMYSYMAGLSLDTICSCVRCGYGMDGEYIVFVDVIRLVILHS